MTKIGDNLGHNDITHKYTYMTCIIVPSWTFHIFQLNNRTWSATVICAYVANVAFLFFIFVRFGELLLYSPFISTDPDSNGYYLLFGLTSNLCTIYNRARAHVLWPTYIHICNDSELYTIMLVTFEPAMKWISSLQSKDICLQRLRSPQSHSNVAFLGFFCLLTDEASFFIHFVQIHCDYRDYPMKKKKSKNRRNACASMQFFVYWQRYVDNVDYGQCIVVKATFDECRMCEKWNLKNINLCISLFCS